MGRKHWEKEKLLVTSNFSFSRSVFKRPVLQTHENQDLFGKGLKTSFAILAPFKLSCANALNLEQSKNCCVVRVKDCC